jgi:hypothetical protein
MRRRLRDRELTWMKRLSRPLMYGIGIDLHAGCALARAFKITALTTFDNSNLGPIRWAVLALKPARRAAGVDHLLIASSRRSSPVMFEVGDEIAPAQAFEPSVSALVCPADFAEQLDNSMIGR